MKSKSALYAKVLIASLEEAKNAQEIAERIARFRHMLKAQRAWRSIGSVARECKRILKEKEGKLALVVRAKSPEKRDGVELHSLLARQGFRVEEEVREELIGGLALLLDNRILVDASIQGKLQKIRSLFHGHNTSF